MPEVTFELQVITPLFLAGANQREIEIPEFDQKPSEKTQAWEFIPEVRAPSFRGLMRYWLRAAVAGLTNQQQVGLKDVRDFEKYIFGATDEGSAVQVRVKTISENIKQIEKEGRSRDQMTGKDYLYWSMVKSGKGNNYKPTRYYFTNDTRLSVTCPVVIDLTSAINGSIFSFFKIRENGDIFIRQVGIFTIHLAVGRKNELHVWFFNIFHRCFHKF